jgi:voltage-gated potassium channel
MSLRFGRLRKGQFSTLLLALILFIVLYPYFEGGPVKGAFMVVMALGIPLTAVYAASDSRRRLVIAIVLCVPAQLALLEYWLHVNLLPGENVPLLFTLLFYVYTIYVVLSHVLSREKVTKDTLAGAAAVYLLFGLTWSLGYSLMERLSPGSFFVAATQNPDGVLSTIDFLYYSYVTLTTLGYGDLTPVTSAARSLAIFESVTGVLFLALLIGRLVAMYTLEPESD